MKKLVLALVVLALIPALVKAQEQVDKKQPVAKTGWSFGALPAIAYDTDVGFRYGGLINLYDFGDGSTYPGYRHSIYMEWSKTTKGSGNNIITYDTEYLIPNTRFTADLRYVTEKALDFYGFNGYNANYVPGYMDKEATDEYLTRVFYRHDRRLLRVKTDFQINLDERKLRLYVGYSHYWNKIDTVDVENINDGAKEEDLLPLDGRSLYSYYVQNGIIPKDEALGGHSNLFELGLVYDTRDRETNPTKGVWAEAFVIGDPGLGSSSSFGKLALIFRHYQMLGSDRLILASRVGFQPKLWGDIPWHMLPYVFNSKEDRDGLGGAKTLRGIMRNRVVGDGFFYGNIELRTVPYKTVVLNQNFYLGIVPFFDFGMVTQPFELQSAVENDYYQLESETESLHMSAGAALQLTLNDNFVVSIAMGKALNERDGDKGLYIGLNYLF